MLSRPECAAVCVKGKKNTLMKNPLGCRQVMVEVSRLVERPSNGLSAQLCLVRGFALREAAPGMCVGYS